VCFSSFPQMDFRGLEAMPDLELPPLHHAAVSALDLLPSPPARPLTRSTHVADLQRLRRVAMRPPRPRRPFAPMYRLPTLRPVFIGYGINLRPSGTSASASPMF
jgi:hypothetical protein